ncbi:MAG: di-heme oxidoredictase family protein, partial [Gemmatimonadales bacterium]
MHDGRAGTIEEAIELHGGEAVGARDRFAALPPRQRAALLRFLGSLEAGGICSASEVP